MCPGANPTIDELVVMDVTARLKCYGDSDLTFRAWLTPHETGVLEFYGRPHWLTAGVGGRRALPIEGDPRATMSLVVHVRPGDRKGLDLPKRGWVRVTGHFDDRAARKCPDHWRERCEQAFVASDVRPAR